MSSKGVAQCLQAGGQATTGSGQSGGKVAPSRAVALPVNKRKHSARKPQSAPVRAVAAPVLLPITLTPKPLTTVLEVRKHTCSGLPSADIPSDFSEAEQKFNRLLGTQDLDAALRTCAELKNTAEEVSQSVHVAVEKAYGGQQEDGDASVTAAHLFLHRILYKINRLALFWYDDLRHYSNDRSLYLAQLRESIEHPWQQWELSHVDIEAYKSMTPDEVKQALQQQAAHDVEPPLSETASYIRHDLSREGYRHLMAVASLDGLVESSRQSRVCGGAANEVSCAIFRVLVEEYGTGRYKKKHSTFFATAMRDLGLNDEPEFYFDLVPWQTLAAINHGFLLTERRRHYLRYNGSLTYFEVAGPSLYRSYVAATRRLGLSEDAAGYWELHIKEDERHGKQMVADVALPLVDMYPESGWEVLQGYDEEKRMGARAGAALLADLKVVDAQQFTPAVTVA